MIRLTRKVFSDLSLWMIGFGLCVGLVFPWFVAALGIPAEFVLTPWFFLTCIAAGFLVGATNILLAKSVVGQRLRLLSERMNLVASKLEEISLGGNPEGCVPSYCSIVVDSDDELGDSARAFNQLITALAQSLQTEAAMRIFHQTLAAHLEIETLCQQALQQMLRHTGAAAGAILIETEGELKLAASFGIRSPHMLATSDHVRHALRTERRHSVVLPEGVMLDGALTDFRPREILIEPLLYKDVILAALVLAHGTGFGHSEQNRLGLLQRELALALQNALLYDRMQRLAALDPLTETYNRRFGLARLHDEFARAVRSGSPLGILMFDLDHFKQVNDTYGHLAGDRVLARIARLARSVLREGDVLVRYGGEEFLAILPGAARHDLQQVGERLRRLVEDTSIVDDGRAIRITVSIGGSAYPEVDVENETVLVEHADRALYLAKESGRNRAIVV
ncbi:MAG TPA: GGDEF domain-containing protein [Methylococcus sp.]|nr:GGDEF domain-containing protein [Methylococcus sp.]